MRAHLFYTVEWKHSRAVNFRQLYKQLLLIAIEIIRKKKIVAYKTTFLMLEIQPVVTIGIHRTHTEIKTSRVPNRSSTQIKFSARKQRGKFSLQTWILSCTHKWEHWLKGCVLPNSSNWNHVSSNNCTNHSSLEKLTRFTQLCKFPDSSSNLKFTESLHHHFYYVAQRSSFLFWLLIRMELWLSLGIFCLCDIHYKFESVFSPILQL